MNRKLLMFVGILGAITAGLYAANTYNATLVNAPALAYSNNYTINLNTTPNAGGITHLSAQAVYSSATLAASSFTDGRVSTGSVTVINNALLTANAATNQITIAPTATILAASATDFLTVLTTFSLTGKVITYNGNPLVGGTNWRIVDTASGTAVNITAAINRFSGVTAVRTNATVALTATAGASGNNKTLTVNTSSITIGGTHFGGGHNNRLATAYLTINGQRYNQGAGWSVMDTSSGTATSIAAMVQRLSGLQAHAAGSVVSATATISGVSGNAFTMSSSASSYMTVTAANFSGGRSNANVCINGTCVIQGTNWTKASTSSGTAKAISDAIMAKTALNTILSSTWSAAGVVSATSTVSGAVKNWTFTTNVPTYLTLSGGTFMGGQTPAWNAGTVINLPAHGFGTALGVTFSTSSAVGLAPLVPNTVYYVGVIDANNIALSSTAVQAVAGTYIGLTTPGATGPHTFTLTPQAYGGTAGMAWFGSSDGTNYNAIDVSSVTYSSPSTTPTSTLWDFGRINYKYVQLQVVAPTSGALDLVVTVTGN